MGHVLAICCTNTHIHPHTSVTTQICHTAQQIIRQMGRKASGKRVEKEVSSAARRSWEEGVKKKTGPAWIMSSLSEQMSRKRHLVMIPNGSPRTNQQERSTLQLSGETRVIIGLWPKRKLRYFVSHPGDSQEVLPRLVKSHVTKLKEDN